MPTISQCTVNTVSAILRQHSIPDAQLGDFIRSVHQGWLSTEQHVDKPVTDLQVEPEQKQSDEIESPEMTLPFQLQQEYEQSQLRPVPMFDEG